MRVVVGVDLGSTTTKAVLLDESGEIVARGITNSRSNYDVACRVALQEALSTARFHRLRDVLTENDAANEVLQSELVEAYKLEIYRDQLEELRESIMQLVNSKAHRDFRAVLEPAVTRVMDASVRESSELYGYGVKRRSDFFRDLAGEAFMTEAEMVCANPDVPFDRLIGLFDRSILDVETQAAERDFGAVLERAMTRLAQTGAEVGGEIRALAAQVASEPIETLSFVGTGYGRQTLPFAKEAIRSEILCHGRGAHRSFNGTRTVLDIGGQDTKAIQVDAHGVVTSFQMNDRCAAGCGRYLGYIADELNLGLHELGPLALKARKMVKVNSTCTVFAGAELRERLALGQRREDILAGLHRAIMLRAMSLLARSGGVFNEFTFTGGVCKNPMATQILEGLIAEHYGAEIKMNAHPDSIYMGALGAALFAVEDVRAGHAHRLATHDRAAA